MLAQLVENLTCRTLAAIAPRAPARIPVDGARTLVLERGRFRYQSTGVGSDAIVLLHGFNAQLATWNPVWRELARGRRVRLDLAGFGDSAWSATSYDLPAQAERVLALADALSLDRLTLVGVSMGASLAAWIAAHHPDRVRGLLLLAPSAYPGALRYRGVFGRLLGRGVANRWATRIAASDRFRRGHPDSRALQALTVTASYGEPWAHALSAIRVHTWLLWSRGDATVPFAYAEHVARALRARTLVPLAADVGHDIPGRRPALIGRLASAIHDGHAPEQVLGGVTDLLAREAA